MRAALLALLLQGCALAPLGEDLGAFYSNPAVLTAELVADAPIQVALLDSPGFMGSHGAQGLWQPVSFVREVRGGLYMLGAYDPAKVPVLFVHGAGGTPQDWRDFIASLDQDRYQAWVYYYPTGLPIETSAVWLDKFVAALHSEYRFRRLVVAGHSMGGLVARRFLALSAGAGRDYQAMLVTLATPWGGVPLASLGVRVLSRSLPSWADLSPDSVFLRRLHADPLPATVKHHLFFAYRHDGDAWDSDGVITVGSQLENQAGAQLHSFKTDHSAILEDPSVLARFATLLAGFD
jgi:pimeloyl-ACP methyl ester carboxylesterase